MSTIKTTGSLMLIGAMFWSCLIIVFAQQPPGDNSAKIRELRAEIRKREEANVPADLKELNTNILIERRAQLRTALRVEIDALKKRKAELGSFVTPEEDQKITSSVQAYEAEIFKLGQDMQRDLAAASTAGGPSTSGAQPTPGPSASNSPRNPAPQPSPSPQPTAPTNAEAAVTPSVIEPVSSKSAAGPPPKVTCTDFFKLGADQQKTVPQFEHKICDLVRVLRERKATGQAKLTLSSGGAEFLETPDYFDMVVVMIAKKSTPAFLVEAEEARVDKQMGTEPSTGGSTSLVVKGGAPAVLGFAVENGALTRNVDKTTVTFRGNPLGVYHALANHGFFQSALDDENDPITRVLRKTSFAFSFDTSRGAQAGVFTATKQQLSAVSARIEFVNKRKPILYLKEWNDFLSTKVLAFADTLRDSKPALVTTESSQELKWRDPALQQWYADTQAALAIAKTDEIESVLRSRLDKLPIADLSPATVAQLNGIEEKIGAYLKGRDEVLDKIAKGTLVTLEYTNKREVNAPDTSSFRFIAEKGTKGRVDFTFNASVTMFNNMAGLRNFVKLNPTLPQPRRFRDFQFAGQIDVPFGSVRDFGQFVFFAGGRYERLLENASTDVGMILPMTKGDIANLQLGLKVPIKGSGIKIPISVTFANRTELVKEKTVRGNFGVTLDLDTLFAKFKPF
jgi:hypothetical protein